jgi:hypothetical protein
MKKSTSKSIGLLALSISILACCVGCNSDVLRKDVVGIYKANYTYGVEDLKLLDDGHYEQTFLMSGDTTPKINSGKWELTKDTKKNCTQVVLQDAMVIDDGFGKPNKDYWKIKAGLSIFCVSTFFGKTSIRINEELDLAYKQA